MPERAAVVELQKQTGRDTFLVVATTEDEDQLRAVVDVVNAQPVFVVCLSAPADLAAERVADRQPVAWPGKAALVDHARVLAERIPDIPAIDVVVSTVDRAPSDVALEVRHAREDRAILRPR